MKFRLEALKLNPGEGSSDTSPACLLEGDIHTFLLIHPTLAAPGWIRIPTPGTELNQEGLLRPHVQQAMPTPPQSVFGIQEYFSRVPAARS